MPFRQGCSTTTKLILFRLFLLNSVTMQQLPADTDVIHLSRSAGMVSSFGYPRTETVSVLWNITVDEDHRLLLQFLDFELVERNPCSFDLFELYDGVFLGEFLIGRWCWDSFDKLTPTTYISNSSSFLLRLRTLEGHSRKGFKANYSSIPKEATTTAAVDITQTYTPGMLTSASTTSTQNVPVKTIPDVPFTTISPTGARETSPYAYIKSTQTAVPITVSTSINTEETNVTESLNLGKYYAIGAGGGFLIIGLFCLTVCCCLCTRKKNKTQDSSKPNDTEFQVLPRAGPVQSLQTSHEGSKFSVKSSNPSQNEFNGRDRKKSSRPQSVGSAFSSPTYAIPDKKKYQDIGKDTNISGQGKVKENEGKSKVSLDSFYATPHGVEADSTEFEINIAYQSCDSEMENGSDMVQVNDEYTYVENTDVITDRPTAAPRVKASEVMFSTPKGEEDGQEEMVSNIAYHSFDLDDEQKEEQAEEEMITNVAYQSCDSEEENVGKSDATYYYVDEEDSDKREEQTDIVYESV